jgi:two-component system, LytTR family, response regulator
MLKCLIVDDEQHAIDILACYAEQIPSLEIVATSSNPLEALQITYDQPIDLIFLDVQMPGISGLDFIRTLQSHKTKIILTTAYSEFAAEGFDLEVVDYLLKPITLPRFLKAVQKALSLPVTAINTLIADTLKDDYIFVKTESKGKMLKINLEDIEYIEGLKNYVGIYHAGKKTLALLNMRELELRLPQKYFVRIHKSYIIAVSRIVSIEGNQVILKNTKAEFAVGNTYKPVFLERMKEKLMQQQNNNAEI